MNEYYHAGEFVDFKMHFARSGHNFSLKHSKNLLTMSTELKEVTVLVLCPNLLQN